MSREKYLKVPDKRIAVIIGENGEVLNKIEEEAGVDVDLDSDTGEVTITGDDFFGLNEARDVIKAISRGFSPEKAYKLFNESYMFEIINLKDRLSTPKEIRRQKGRVIGTDGKTRRKIEQDSKCLISVYGKTISIIGPMENMEIAKKAVDKLIGGAPHGHVYRFLEEERKQRRTEPWMK